MQLDSKGKVIFLLSSIIVKQILNDMKQQKARHKEAMKMLRNKSKIKQRIYSNVVGDINKYRLSNKAKQRSDMKQSESQQNVLLKFKLSKTNKCSSIESKNREDDIPKSSKYKKKKVFRSPGLNSDLAFYDLEKIKKIINSQSKPKDTSKMFLIKEDRSNSPSDPYRWKIEKGKMTRLRVSSPSQTK